MGYLDDYVAGLPAGLRSFPAYRAKASMVRTALEVLPVSPDRPGLPDVLVRNLRHMPQTGTWIAETEWIALCLAIADVHRLDAAGFYRFWYDTMARLTGGLYAAILWFIDPRTVLRRAAVRWAVFHDGLAIEAAARDTSLELRLIYPPTLLPPIIIEQGYVAVWQALVDRSRRPEGKVRLSGVEHDAARGSTATFLAEGWLR